MLPSPLPETGTQLLLFPPSYHAMVVCAFCLAVSRNTTRRASPPAVCLGKPGTIHQCPVFLPFPQPPTSSQPHLFPAVASSPSLDVGSKRYRRLQPPGTEHSAGSDLPSLGRGGEYLSAGWPWASSRPARLQPTSRSAKPSSHAILRASVCGHYLPIVRYLSTCRVEPGKSMAGEHQPKLKLVAEASWRCPRYR
ncbi:hypothetical protein F4780DRAFT_237947 [Xylariomycetidae sp. FL0641]|nr:hypothetical protein F4780DRAFT_237947 [Xylariomycetidae sp. FL0641]